MATRRRPGVRARVNKDGTTTYEIRWRQGGGRDGRRLSHAFTREREAADALTRIQASGNRCHCPEHAPPGVPTTRGYGVAKAGPTTTSAPTFGDYADRHIASLTGIGAGYREQLRRDVARHFAPFLERPLDGIEAVDVREWVRACEDGEHPWLMRRKAGTDNEYVRRPLSPTTIRRLLAQAGGVMAEAHAAGLVSRNPFRGHRVGRRDPHKRPEDDMQVLTTAEWSLLQSCIPEGVYRDLATTLVGTGLRWGEAAALPVGAIDVLADPPRLHVAQAWKKDGAGGVVLGPPKSARSRRTVTFSTAVRDALIPHLAGKGDDELVFTTPSGRPLHHSNFYNKVWLPAVRAAQQAGLGKRPRLHDLRHTYVSWLIAAGRPIAEISRRVGHQSYHLTADRYGHMMPESDEAAIAALERAMPGGPPPA